MEFIRCPIWIDHSISVNQIRETCAKDCRFLQKGDILSRLKLPTDCIATFVRITKYDPEYNLPIALIEWEDGSHYTEDIICLVSKAEYSPNDIEFYRG